MQEQILASLLYSAWAEAAKWRTPTGAPLEDYVDLDRESRDQWLAVAKTAIAMETPSRRTTYHGCSERTAD